MTDDVTSALSSMTIKDADEFKERLSAMETSELNHMDLRLLARKLRHFVDEERKRRKHDAAAGQQKSVVLATKTEAQAAPEEGASPRKVEGTSSAGGSSTKKRRKPVDRGAPTTGIGSSGGGRSVGQVGAAAPTTTKSPSAKEKLPTDWKQPSVEDEVPGDEELLYKKSSTKKPASATKGQAAAMRRPVEKRQPAANQQAASGGTPPPPGEKSTPTTDGKKKRTKKKSKKPEPDRTEERWSMYASLHPLICEELYQEDLTFLNADTENGCTRDYDTNITGSFECTNTKCKKKGWVSWMIAIRIRMYDEGVYNAKVYHQECGRCKQRAKPTIDNEVYVSRVVYRLKKWLQYNPTPPEYDDESKAEHMPDKCEGCKDGHCPYLKRQIYPGLFGRNLMRNIR